MTGCRGNRSPAYSRSRKMTTSLSRGRSTVFPARGSAGPDHAVLHQGAHVGIVNLASAERVRLRDLLRDGIASPLRGPCMQSKSEVETKAAVAEGNLTTVSSRALARLGSRTRPRCAAAQGSVPFLQYISADNRAGNEKIYLFTPTTTSHNGKISKGQHTSFTRIRVSVGRPWEFRSPFLAR
jgi:hypothetical protein